MNVNDILKELKLSLMANKNIDESVYNDYIKTINIHKKGISDYIVVVKSQFGLLAIKQFRQTIENEIKNILKEPVNISFTYEQEYKKQLEKDELINKDHSDIITKKVKKINENTFENFVIGASNEQAFIAVQTVSKNPGISYNPLFIYGESGMGKTHLLKAAKNYIESNFSDLKVSYMSGDEFARKAVDILQKTHKEIEQFKNEVCQNDVLIIDDVQFLSYKEKTNEIFFTIFNNSIENDKQLFFSSDKSPELLNGFDNRLITRFNMGLSIAIQKLDNKTATAIIKKEIKNQNIKSEVTSEAINFISNYYSDDVRKIKGSVSRLNFWSQQNPEEKIITIEIISGLFRDIPTSKLGILNVKKIKEVVSEKYGISVNAIDGKARSKSIVTARHIAMFLTKEILNHTLAQIGEEFGGRDHTTVINAERKIETMLKKDKQLKKTVDILKNKILTK
ncbi:chromosomal replication initiator protein DnaA [unidentified plasmid]|uniref:chromosomal replication initiator protein DnaA n=1 Tax=Mycoplasma mycoides TaxID=2102 RepID=UPI0001793E93|nr:chromosomal replication initiator protein DnaA [Mycoplasma mycoides]ACU79064.1 chromosomal replication initiator protein DnaA [Mycoplasma mycoides subsp. capri str. GM12]ACU79318.1 chromosomal replication initiator protein DnaA [unidentified plasmid] [Mycoplasma mycoides subsp. capri str. GM12]